MIFLSYYQIHFKIGVVYLHLEPVQIILQRVFIVLKLITIIHDINNILNYNIITVSVIIISSCFQPYAVLLVVTSKLPQLQYKYVVRVNHT
jgi:hypothetical protein